MYGPILNAKIFHYSHVIVYKTYSLNRLRIKFPH